MNINMAVRSRCAWWRIFKCQKVRLHYPGQLVSYINISLSYTEITLLKIIYRKH